MAEMYELGSQLREFLRGLLDGSQTAGPRGPATVAELMHWGPRVNVAGLKDNYAPQKVEPYRVPPAGIDNLALHSTDAFMIPGRGEFIIDFKGYFRVARDHPTTNDWATEPVSEICTGR